MRSFTVATASSESLEPRSAAWHSHLISQQRGFPRGSSFLPYPEFLPSNLNAKRVWPACQGTLWGCWSHGGLCGFLSRVHEPLLVAHLEAAQPPICSEMAPGSDKASGPSFHSVSWSTVLAACPAGHLAASKASRHQPPDHSRAFCSPDCSSE